MMETDPVSEMMMETDPVSETVFEKMQSDK